MNRFKPGDKARVIGNMSSHGLNVGNVVEVTEHFPENHRYDEHYRVTGDWLIFDCDLEPIEPVQEEESQKFFPLEFRLKNIDLIADSVDIEYVVKYDQALQLAESTISRLKSEIEELKRKA